MRPFLRATSQAYNPSTMVSPIDYGVPGIDYGVPDWLWCPQLIMVSPDIESVNGRIFAGQCLDSSYCGYQRGTAQ